LFAEGGGGRSAWSRRWRDLCLSHAKDLGGTELLSEAQISIVKRVAALECECERLEAQMSEGKAIDTNAYGRLCGRLARMVELIGIKRFARPLDPQGELARAFAASARAIDDEADEDEPAAIEEGLDKEPGEA